MRAAALSWLGAAGAALSLAACAPVTWVGMKFLYREAEIPPAQIHRDLCYVSDSECGEKRRLDLYRPSAAEWPVIVFVHGGGWTEGDKRLTVAGDDVYGNIGRFYAGRGIGVAVINYRLMPEVGWKEQVEDVRRAVGWVRDRVAAYGGNPEQIFLMGHSAGAHLASLAALEIRKDMPNVLGVVAVSGAALDLTDQVTYDLGEDIRYYEKRFKGADETDEWKTVASPLSRVSAEAPPFLLLYAGGESKGLQRQTRRLAEALERTGVPTRLVVVPGESHSRIVLTLSRPDKTAGPAIIDFVAKRLTK